MASSYPQNSQQIQPTKFTVTSDGTRVLEVRSEGSSGLVIDWGTGDTPTSAVQYEYKSKVYPAGTYQGSVRVLSPNNFSALRIGGSALVSVEQIQGDLKGISYYTDNQVSPNLVAVPPPHSNLQMCSNMFRGASSFNQNIGSWDMSNVLSTSSMFFGATAFNQDISGWNTANVQIMNYMFHGAANFNQPIGIWNTSNVNNMDRMFFNAASFNQDISGWNTANVQNMEYMFSGAANFNQPIGIWNTSSVIDMVGTFFNAVSFNQDLSSWCVSNIPTAPDNFDLGATSWVLPRPVWGTCPGG
jgi:surface protein